jgi:hypothetical protein
MASSNTVTTWAVYTNFMSKARTNCLLVNIKCGWNLTMLAVALAEAAR